MASILAVNQKASLLWAKHCHYRVKISFHSSVVDIIRNEILKQNQCFSDHKLLMLSQCLLQVNVAGIYLSREHGLTKPCDKTSQYRAGSSNP